MDKTTWFHKSILFTKMIKIGIVVTCCAYSAITTGTEDKKINLKPPQQMLQWRPTLVRESQAVYGLNAPVPMFAAQITQESGGVANTTAPDLGRGLAQFMDGTSQQISKLYPELGAPDPYNPKWAIRALIRYDSWLSKRVKGKDECEVWGSALKGYNAGLGYVQRAEKKSETPDIWFTKTEYVPSGQSQKNFLYSQKYPRWILFKHQLHYLSWGHVVCDVKNPPIDMLPMK
jgi:hypothetical protein